MNDCKQSLQGIREREAVRPRRVSRMRPRRLLSLSVKKATLGGPSELPRALRPPKADGKARSGRLDVVPPARGDVERVPGAHSAVPVRHAGQPGPVLVGLAVEVDRAAVGVHALSAVCGDISRD